MGARFGALAAWAAARARPLVAITAALAVAASVGAASLPTDGSVGTFVDSDSASYRATREVREAFGEEPIVVVAEGRLQQLLLSDDLFQLLRLEGCLSGKVPKGAKPIPGPCTELAQLHPVETLAGPATFLNEAVVQIDAQLKRLSRHVPASRLRELLIAIAARYGITSLPSLDNEEFVATVVFDLSRPTGTPKSRLAYLFPNRHAAQIVLRLRPDLSGAERRRAVALIEAVVAEEAPRKACPAEGKAAPCFKLSGGRYVVSGAPVVVDAIGGALKEALLILAAVALVVMALALVAVFRSRLRLLPLALAAAATAIVFGVLDLLGGSLTLAGVGALPVLIGLGVDYAIQFQARFDEAEESGLEGAAAARAAASAGAPTIATACLATVAGALALQLSPVPMVRGFGWLLVAGLLLAFFLALTVGLAALSLRRGSAAHGDVPHASSRPLAAIVDLSLGRPKLVLAVAAFLAVAGWGLGTQVETVADVQSLAPRGLRAVEDLDRVRDATGVSGQLEVSVEAPDLYDPATLEWMADFKRRVLAAGGYGGENPSCLRADVCPGPALSDFVLRAGAEPTRSEVEATVGALSPYALRQVAPIEPGGDRLGHLALLSFGIRSQSLADQEALIDAVQEAIGPAGKPGGPPPGVEVKLAGLPVVAAESARALSSSRYWLTLGGLLAVALALLIALRSLGRALLPLVPTVLATGWASLLIWISGIPLNPMSAALGALTIAIATEFAVILCGRVEEERGGGGGLEAAVRRAYERTGAAVLASAATAIAGFAVLVASDVQMLRDFGIVTVVDLLAGLLGVLLVLPAAMALWERR